MQRDSEESDRRSAADFARRVASIWDDYLGSRLLGAYLMGSLAHGGFGRYSDIDVAVVLVDSLTPANLAEMRQKAAAVSTDHAAKLSLFWTDRGFAVGRFPPLDRIDYLDHAVCLIEREAVRPERPSLAGIRTYLRGAPFERWAARALEFSAAKELDPADRKPYLRALLYPARFMYSWLTGDIASNDDAVAFLRNNRPRKLDLNIIGEALRCRNDGRDPDDLFAARHVLVPHVEACAELIADAPTT